MAKRPTKLPPPPPPPPEPASREEAMDFLRWMYRERMKRKKPWRSFDDKAFREALPKRFAGSLRAIARRVFADMVRGTPPPAPKRKPHRKPNRSR